MAPPVRLRELSQEAQLEVDGFAADMLRHLGLPADAEPAAVASAIDSWVETLRVDPARISDDQAFWLAARLGCLWGEAIVKAHGWMWREREVDGDWYLTVVEPRLRYFHDPVPCAQACLAGRGRNPDLESVLRSFGTLAPTRDGALADIFLGRGRPRVSSPGAADDGAAAGSERAMSVLEAAIGDVGCWTWWQQWTQSSPQLFRAEFSRVQLWVPPNAPGEPPAGSVELVFPDPSLVAFLTSPHAKALPSDWQEALCDGRIDGFEILPFRFTLTSDDDVAAMAEGYDCTFLVGTADDLAAPSPFRLAFRAGDVGLVVRGGQMGCVARSGSLGPKEVIDASTEWESYWREYWDRRDTDSPMPSDPACEVTFPPGRLGGHGS